MTEYWIIDPLEQRLEAYRLDTDGKYRRVPARGGRVMSKVVRGFYLRPEWLFQNPPIEALDALRELGVI